MRALGIRALVRTRLALWPLWLAWAMGLLVGCRPVYPQTRSAMGLTFSWATQPQWSDIDQVEDELEALIGPGCWQRAGVAVTRDDFGCLGSKTGRCHGQAWGDPRAGELPAAQIGNVGCGCRSELAHELIHVDMLCQGLGPDYEHTNWRWLLEPARCAVCPGETQ